jgi:hypothetical protein
MLTLEIPNTVTDIATLRRNIVAVASRELQRWNDGGRRTETDPRMRATLIDYWKNGAGVNVTPAQVASAAFQQGHPWSAAFISWVMKQAGAGRAFRYAASHSVYVHAAKQNRLANNGNPFQAYRISEAIPAPGDLVCKSRNNSGATYDNIRPGMATHCDVVVSTAPGQISVIGGNVNNSVSRKTVRTDANGRINVPGYFAIIKVGSGAAAPAPRPTPTPTRTPTPAPPNITPANPSEIGRTLYSAIDIGVSGTKKQTGIFCPARWRPSEALDLVVYFHGIRTVDSIDAYWDAKRNPHFALREDLHASGKNALLVAPLLGPRSQSQIGTLRQAGGFDRFLDSVLQSIQQNGWITGPARVGNIIFACHSGGGLSMRTIALANNNAASQIRECWGFDCTYNGDDSVVWPRWAAKMPNSQLRLYYLKGTQTQYQAKEIEKRRVPNITVATSHGRNHNWVPRAHFLDLLRASTALRNV